MSKPSNSNKLALALALALALGGLLGAATSQAHVNIARENVFALGDAPREYLEGSSAFISVNLPHDCSNRDTGKHFATTDVAILLPNGTGLDPDVAFTSNHRTGETFGANAVMGTKARVSAVWKKVMVRKDAVDPFYSHGLRTEDARAIYWLKGLVDNDHYDNLEIKTSFPHLTGCTERLEIKVPSVQYCKKGYATAWIGTDQSSVFAPGTPKLRLTPTYTPHFAVVRDLEKNPLPAECNGVGETVKAMPSVEEIDQYLPLPDHD